MVATPRLIELCFQTAGIWELGTTGRMALPSHIDRVELFGSPPNGDRRVRDRPRRTAASASTPRSSTATGRLRCACTGTARSRCPTHPTPTRCDHFALRWGDDGAGRVPIEQSRPPWRLTSRRLAVVNRGTAAIRCINAVAEYNRERGREIRTIAVFGDADRDALFVREAHEAVFAATNGGSHVDAFVEALERCGADAVWVGWGVAAEHADFSTRCARPRAHRRGPEPRGRRPVQRQDLRETASPKKPASTSCRGAAVPFRH